MEDLIRREDAIDAINLRARIPHDIASAQYASMAINAIRTVPSADRPQGEWQDTGKDPDHSHPLTAIWYRCSECGDGTNTKTNYCPNCGAKMKQ